MKNIKQKGSAEFVVILIVIGFIALCIWASTSISNDCRDLGGVPVYQHGQNCWKDGGYIDTYKNNK